LKEGQQTQKGGRGAEVIEKWDPVPLYPSLLWRAGRH